MGFLDMAIAEGLFIHAVSLARTTAPRAVHRGTEEGFVSEGDITRGYPNLTAALPGNVPEGLFAPEGDIKRLIRTKPQDPLTNRNAPEGEPPGASKTKTLHGFQHTQQEHNIKGDIKRLIGSWRGEACLGLVGRKW